MKISFGWKDPEHWIYTDGYKEFDWGDPKCEAALAHAQKVLGSVLDEQLFIEFDTETGKCTIGKEHFPITVPKIQFQYVPKELPPVEEKIPKTNDEIMVELKNAAEVLLKSNYSMDVLAKMQVAYRDCDYEKVLAMAAVEDVPKREELDAKITQVRNPRYEKIDGNVREVNEEGEDKVAPYLFKIEGIDKLFGSAAEAAAALRIEKPTKHLFKPNHIPDAHKRGSCQDEDNVAIDIDLGEENDNQCK